MDVGLVFLDPSFNRSAVVNGSSVNVTDPVSVVLINAENVRVTVVVLAR